MGRIVLAVLAALVELPGPGMAAENAIFDRNGRLTSIVYGGDELAVRGRVEIPAPDGNTVAEAGPARRDADRNRYESTITTSSGQSVRLRQAVSEEGGKIWIALEVTADAELDAGGVYYTIEVPRAEFAGGRATVATASGARAVDLPRLKPVEREFLRAEGSAVTLNGATRNLSLAVTLDAVRSIALAERWTRAGRTYAAMIRIGDGALPAGRTASVKLALALTGDPDRSPARVKVDPAARRYQFQGFGGNYCFNIESPVTNYTLQNLNVGWARTEMSLSQWEPENDNDSPAVTNWDYFNKRVEAFPRLAREMQLAKQIQDRGIPYIISIWAIPEWIYTDPGPRPQRRGRRRIAPDKWDELLESIGSYLLFAKQRYGAEPDMFSFNEANIGVDVLLTPEEHRDSIKRLGAHFEKLGLKTRLLLGDATGPRNTHEWALAAAADPAAMRYVKAVAFHSWGGGTPEQYQAWGDLAEWLQLPLLVTELGVDASAYMGRLYDSFHYGIREVRMYQELLLHARPQGTQQWEFTGDYAIVRTRPRADNGVDLIPTHRFWFVKHFTDLTPRDSAALATSSDNPNVLVTAFAKGPVYTIHVANTAAARQVVIEGLPAAEFRAVRTSEEEEYRQLPPLRPQAGVLRVDLPARALLTLTTK